MPTINQVFRSALLSTFLISFPCWAGLTGSDQSQNENALQEMAAEDVLKLTADSMPLRQMQTRKFETKNIKGVLDACVGFLQDNGFNVDEIAPKLGTVLGSKSRDAVESGQVAASIVFSIIFGTTLPTDKEQKMMASIVVSESASDAESTIVRATFSRIVWNDRNAVSKAERLEAPEVYQEFFEKLSKSLFLEEQKI